MRLSLIVAALCICGASAASIRGLDPSLILQYSGADGTFACLDGSKTIPFARVNDDYCDCQDGSDEPGDRDVVILNTKVST